MKTQTISYVLTLKNTCSCACTFIEWHHNQNSRDLAQIEADMIMESILINSTSDSLNFDCYVYVKSK